MKRIWLLLFVIVCLVFPYTVYASEPEGEAEYANIQETAQETLLSEFAFDEMDGFLEEIFTEQKISFQTVLQGMYERGYEILCGVVWAVLSDRVFYEWRQNKSSVVHILMIVLIAAVFTNFSSVFQNHQIAEISFYVLYLLLLTISLNAFRLFIASAEENLGHLLTFMKLLGPSYFLALAFASGSSTSVMFYNLVLLLIYLVELLIVNFLLPCIQIFIVVRMLNNLSQEDYLSKLGELLETVILWTLKTLMAGVIGLNMIQGLLSPAIDSLKRSVLTKSAEAIPVVGDALGGTAEVMLGTAVLIKNGIGVTGAVICIVICLIPVIQMAVVTILYKFVAAMIQPVSDKRIVDSISSIADGSGLLPRLVFTSGLLFLLTIAIVTATTM